MEEEEYTRKILREKIERVKLQKQMKQDEITFTTKIKELTKKIKDIEDKDIIDKSEKNIKIYEGKLKDIETIRLRHQEEIKEYEFLYDHLKNEDTRNRIQSIEEEENLQAVLRDPTFIVAMQEEQQEQRRQQIIKHNKLPINIPLPPYGDDQEYKDMISELILTVGNPGIIKFKKPTKTEAGFVNLKVLAMYCHADKPNYKKLADKLKGLFLDHEKTLYEDNGEEYNLDSILDDVCSYLGHEGGRRNKYKKRKTNKSKKSRKHIRSRRLSRSRRPVKSRRYKKSRK